MLAALEDFGFGSLPLSVDELVAPDLVIQLGYPPHRIDLLTGIDGIEFDEAWERRISVRIDEDELPFISRDDLITNKLAAGRPKDLADVAALEEAIIATVGAPHAATVDSAVLKTDNAANVTAFLPAFVPAFLETHKSALLPALFSAL